jgi:putative transcriptional regulator
MGAASAAATATIAIRVILALIPLSSSVTLTARELTGHNEGAMAESLRGKLLIAGPTLLDPNFARTVVLIAEHTDEGAMGLVLNRPAETLVDEAVPDLGWMATDDERVWVGGPVAETAVIVLAEWERPELAGALVDGDLGFVGADADQPDQLDGAIRRARVFAGHAGWGPGQLEEELEEESWIVEPPEREEIFTDDPDALWGNVLRRKGSRWALLATMPPDPSVN